MRKSAPHRLKERKGNVLGREFFERETLTVAEELLGKYLVRDSGGVLNEWRIIETEAYDGPDDLACHASKGRTKRTEVMFGPAGFWYVYFIYGMYNMLNVVTGPPGYPAGVLIRAVEGVRGPGRLTRALGISRDLYGKPTAPESGLWIEDRGIVVAKRDIERTPRIGVAYAKEWAERPWRFVME